MKSVINTVHGMVKKFIGIEFSKMGGFFKNVTRFLVINHIQIYGDLLNRVS